MIIAGTFPKKRPVRTERAAPAEDPASSELPPDVPGPRSGGAMVSSQEEHEGPVQPAGPTENDPATNL